MKKRAILLIGVSIALFFLAGCVPPDLSDSSASTPPEGVLSFDELLANLDALEGPEARSPTEPDKSVFPLPRGGSLSLGDLSRYLNSIRNDFAAYVRSSSGGRLYLVQYAKLTMPDSTSALMWVPFTWGIRKSFPVLSYQHGTQVYRACAPSRFNANPLSVLSSPDQTGAFMNYVECIVGGLMASAGYIVVMPDYPGFGDSTALHPYVDQALGVSVKNAVLATRAALAGRTVRTNNEIYLTGYSEGGYATMAGAKELTQAGIQIDAVVPGAGPYDLSGIMLAQMTSGGEVVQPSYLLQTASGYNAAHPGVFGLSNLIASSWLPYVTTANLFDGNHTNAQVAAAVPSSTIPSDMLNHPTADGLLAPGGAVYNLLAMNNGYAGWGIHLNAPLYCIHCEEDDVVPYQNAVVALTAFQARGVSAGLLHFVPVPHVEMLETFLGSAHAAAYPTAMLAAFMAIQFEND